MERAPGEPPDGTGSSADHIAQLRDVLNIDQRRAQKLYNDADCDFDAAVALHFADQQAEAGPSNHASAGARDRASQLQQALRCMGFPSITVTQAKKLLRQTGNSIERGAELYLSDPAAAGPPGPRPRAEVIDLVTSNEQEHESDNEEDRSGIEEGSEREDDGEGEEESGSGEEDDGDADAGEGEPLAIAGFAEADSNDEETEFEEPDNVEDVAAALLASAACGYDKHFKLTVHQQEAPSLLPHLDEALYLAACSKPRVDLSKIPLPLRNFRSSDGKLYCDNGDTVPAVVKPSSPLQGATLLGSILLPIHAINKRQLKALKAENEGERLKWDETSALAYCYSVPMVHSLSGAWAFDLHGMREEDASDLRRVLNGELHVQLVLGGSELNDMTGGSRSPEAWPAVVVRQEKSWVNQFVGALGLLNMERMNSARTKVLTPSLLSPVFTLVKRKSSKKRKRGAKEEEDDDDDDDDPTHVKVKVYLKEGAAKLFFDGESGENVQWPKHLGFSGCYGPAMAELLSTLLTHGQGLTVRRS